MPRSKVSSIIVAGLLLFLAGCASKATVHGMTVSPAEVSTSPVSPALEQAVGIGVVTGGEETNPMWTSEVGNAEFREALINSLKVERIYSDDPGSRLVLDAHLIDVNQPLIGFDTTVTSTVKYVLSERGSPDALAEELVIAKYTAEMSDAWYGVERLKLANEGSIRNNIAQFIRRLRDRFKEDNISSSRGVDYPGAA
jgi:hypothetical protein